MPWLGGHLRAWGLAESLVSAESSRARLPEVGGTACGWAAGPVWPDSRKPAPLPGAPGFTAGSSGSPTKEEATVNQSRSARPPPSGTEWGGCLVPGEGALAVKLLSTKDRQVLPGSWLFHQVLAGWLYLWGAADGGPPVTHGAGIGQPCGDGQGWVVWAEGQLLHAFLPFGHQSEWSSGILRGGAARWALPSPHWTPTLRARLLPSTLRLSETVHAGFHLLRWLPGEPLWEERE